MQQIVGCKDPIAQEYLMECIIQVFPDELHLQTLDVFLEPCGKLHPKVNVKNIIIALMDRLASFSLSETAGESEALKEMHDKLFEMFSAQIALTIKGRPDMPIEDVVALQHSLVNLALKCYPGRIDYVDQVLAYTCTALKEVGKVSTREINHSTPVFNPLMKLLQLPAESTSVSMVLKFEHYVPLIEFLGYDLRKELACFSIQSLVQNDVKLTTADEVSTFLDIVDPLIQDQPDQNLEDEDEDEFSEEQCLVGRMIQCFKGSTPDLQYTILSATRKRLGTGAGCERRIKRTLPAIIFQGLQLVLQYNKMTAEDDSAAEAKMAKIFKFLHQTITALSKAEFTDLALRMFLQAALTSDQTSFAKSEDITYEFMNQAFSLYEDDVADSKAQIDAITLIIATLERLTIFGEENFSPFATKSALVASKLMRKVDQAKGVCLCSFVFWSNQLELAKNSDDAPDGKQVRQCLTKALKVANSCMEPAEQVKLFVEIFNYYIIFYEKKCTAIKLEDLNKLVVLIRENIGSVEGDKAAPINTYFENALLHIKNAKSSESTVSYDGFEG